MRGGWDLQRGGWMMKRGEVRRGEVKRSEVGRAGLGLGGEFGRVVEPMVSYLSGGCHARSEWLGGVRSSPVAAR